MKLSAAVFFAGISQCLGHGAIVQPRSRNAVDPETHAHVACGCSNGTETCNNGQACYWYNQGCFIGCDACDSLSGRAQADICGSGKNATLNDPSHRTVNRNATAGTDLDIYKHNPWRAPGNAPVVDSCGLAGGTPWPKDVGEWGSYVTSEHATHGDHGSTHLKKNTSLGGTTWTAGEEAEVIWQITANHGGGYQYRLCPADQALTEDCFRNMPLEFNQDRQAILLKNGSRIPIPGTFVSEGTEPAHSTWAMNPIPPTCLGGGCGKDYQCKPCPLPVFKSNGVARDCTSCDNSELPSFPSACGSQCQGNEGDASVVDYLKVPGSLKPGEYVLGWRLDCEATAQVWTNCADVTVVSKTGSLYQGRTSK